MFNNKVTTFIITAFLSMLFVFNPIFALAKNVELPETFRVTVKGEGGAWQAIKDQYPGITNGKLAVYSLTAIDEATGQPADLLNLKKGQALIVTTKVTKTQIEALTNAYQKYDGNMLIAQQNNEYPLTIVKDNDNGDGTGGEKGKNDKKVGEIQDGKGTEITAIYQVNASIYNPDSWNNAKLAVIFLLLAAFSISFIALTTLVVKTEVSIARSKRQLATQLKEEQLKKQEPNNAIPIATRHRDNFQTFALPQPEPEAVLPDASLAPMSLQATHEPQLEVEKTALLTVQPNSIGSQRQQIFNKIEGLCDKVAKKIEGTTFEDIILQQNEMFFKAFPIFDKIVQKFIV